MLARPGALAALVQGAASLTEVAGHMPLKAGCLDLGDGYYPHQFANFPAAERTLWRRMVPQLLERYAPHRADGTLDGDLYEFGVFNGRSLRQYYRMIKNCSKLPMWGFDSFKGLPPDPTETRQIKEFAEGRYSFSNLKSLQQSKALGGGGTGGKTRFIKGFYNESLTESLALEHGMRPAVFIDIDTDLYISTVQARAMSSDQDWRVCAPLQCMHSGSLTCLDAHT